MDGVIGAVGAVIAASSLMLSLTAARASRRRSRVDVLTTLHAGFLAIYSKLPPNLGELRWEKWTLEQKQAGRSYWQHARLEHLATKQSGDKVIAGLWSTYFAEAQAAGSEHPALLQALREVVGEHNVRQLWNSYIQDLNEARRLQSLEPLNI